MNRVLAGYNRHIFHGQSGMVLLFCLIFLTALTLLGLSAYADTVLQNKLAANLQDAERAKQSALATLSWAEQWLFSLPGPAPQYCTEPCDGLYLYSAGQLPPHPEFENLSWWTEHGHEAGVDPLSGDRIKTITRGSIDTPIWIIEAVHAVPPSENGTTDLQVWYRILARGSGRSAAAVSVIESTVVRSWASLVNAQLPGDGVSGTCPGSDPETLCGRLSWRELR